MKSAMCYSGIIILFVLIILPPILRITLPDSLFEEAKETEIHNMNLRCQNDKYFVTTNYDYGKIKIIVIKKMLDNKDTDISDNVTDENNDQTVNNTDSETDFDKVFDRLKEQLKDAVIIQNDGEVISIDFTLSDNSNLDVAKIIQPLESQKLYYEKQNMACSILT